MQNDKHNKNPALNTTDWRKRAGLHKGLFCCKNKYICDNIKYRDMIRIICASLSSFVQGERDLKSIITKFPVTTTENG